MPGEPLGLTPIAQAAASIGMGLAAENYGLRYFKDSANPSSILRTDQTLTDERRLSGTRSSGSRRMVGGDATQPSSAAGSSGSRSASPRTSPSSSKRRGFQISDIAMFFGIPPHLIGQRRSPPPTAQALRTRTSASTPTVCAAGLAASNPCSPTSCPPASSSNSMPAPYSRAISRPATTPTCRRGTRGGCRSTRFGSVKSCPRQGWGWLYPADELRPAWV